MSPERRSRLQPGSIACLLLLLGAAAAAQRLPAGVAGMPPGPWREAPEFVALFAPSPPRSAAYRAAVSPATIDTLLPPILQDPALQRIPGAWEPRAVVALEAFGQSGRYDRAAVTRLYGARRPLVVRGARRAPSGAIESWTLISPYPDVKLQRLETGTLLIVLNVP